MRKGTSLRAGLGLLIALCCLQQSPATAGADTIFGPAGSAAGHTSSPQALAVDDETGDLYVADRGNNRIDVFDETGAFIRAFGWGVDTGAAKLEVCTIASSCQAGIGGSGAGQFKEPTGVAVDNDPTSPSHHDVYVYDGNDRTLPENNNNRIERFTPAGAFVLAFGDGVDHTSGGDVCTAASSHVCGGGLQGYGPGQFNRNARLAVGGTVYVTDEQGDNSIGFDHRVQAFEPSGLLIGQPFSESAVPGFAGPVSSVAADPGGDFYLAISGSPIRKFDSTGALLDAFNPSFNVGGIGVDGSTGDVFVVDQPSLPMINGSGVLNVYDPTGNQASVIYPESPRVLAAVAARGTSSGGVYAVRSQEGPLAADIARIPLPPPGPVAPTLPGYPKASPVKNTSATLRAVADPEGKATGFRFQYVDQAHFKTGGFSNPATQETAEVSLGAGFGAKEAVQPIAALAPETTYHFRVLATNADGTVQGPAGTFTTLQPFEIEATWATNVGADSATIHAEVNPIGIPATAYFQYVDDASFRVSEFATATDVPDVAGGELPIDIGAGEVPVEVEAILASLSPGIVYHYRVVAEDSFVSEPGPTQAFTTFPVPSNPQSCPINQDFRTGASAKLPDCRAYEMVSPIDKNGGDVAAIRSSFPYGTLAEVTADGDKATFSSLRPFANPQAAPLINQYLSVRGPGGWAARSITPPRRDPPIYGPGFAGQFKSFDEDLCNAWLMQESDLALAEGALPGVTNLYRRDNCGTGEGEEGKDSYELIAPPKAPGFGSGPGELKPELFYPVPQGHSADHLHSVYRADAQLTNNACAAPGIFQVYEATQGGPLRLVSVLPPGKGGTAVCNNSSAGTMQGFEDGFREASVYNAVSADGERVFWTDSGDSEIIGHEGTVGAGPGMLYLRLNASQAPSPISGGECTQPAKACTVAISEFPSRFWAADPEGTKALYTVDEELFEYDVAEAKSQLISKGTMGVVGESEDLGRVYFVSSELLTGIEANIFGEEAVKGQPNLYLAEGGAFTFIGRLGSEEALAYIDLNNERKRPSAPDSLQPVQRTSRVSSDGRHLAFTTTRPLSGYDNTDQTSGQPDTELFLYDADPGAGPGTLACVSCNPTQARPTGRKVGKFPAAEAFSWAAALLPGWSEQLKPSRLLSADGNRLYFESFDALTPRDQNGMQDVYQWERATSAAQCEEAGAELFSAEAGGCLSLISTGEDEEDSELIDASVGAKDVFFATEASLLPQDPALVDLYDAREGGGFPVEVSPIDCEGEACQPRSPAPLLPGNSSEVRGQPNAKPASTKCPKGKHKVTKKGKARCVKNKKAKKQKRANKSGRATR